MNGREAARKLLLMLQQLEAALRLGPWSLVEGRRIHLHPVQASSREGDKRPPVKR